MSWSSDRTNFDRNIAVVIGINNYQNGIHPLRTAVNDASAIADLLEQEYKYQEVIRLFPPHGEATWKELNKVLSTTLPEEIKPTDDDRLLFYFAGHGVATNSQDGPEGFLIPQDAKLENAENFFPMRNLIKSLSELNCHHLLVILDCCFAGTLRWSSTRNVIPIPEKIHREHYDRFIRCRAWQSITSAAHNQQALDFVSDSRDGSNDCNHSPFALALLDGLKDLKADFTKDGVITVPELYLYVRDRLISKDGYSELQTPGIWPLQKHDRGEFIFTLPGFDPEKKLQPAPSLDKDNNPYRGLEAFEEKHSRFFFGRSEQVKDLYKKLSLVDEFLSKLTVVLGISGAGKSSLVQAGLIPYLRKKPEEKWHILDPMRPGESPFIALASTILELVELPGSEQLYVPKFSSDDIERNIEQLEAEITNRKKKDKTQELKPPFDSSVQSASNWDYETKVKNLSQRLHSDPHQFMEIVNSWSKKHPDAKLLLVIDQLEELITMSRNIQESKQDNQPSEWQQFLQLLEEILKANLEYLRIVVTLRSDFESRFLSFDVLRSHWTKARFPVRPMRSDELREAIEGPANEMALYFDPSNLVDKLIDQVGQMPGALPLLSFTLSELYVNLYEKWQKDKNADRALTIDAEFDKEGGVAGSLTRTAEREYEGLPDNAHRATMRRVMLRMVTMEGGELARRRVSESELVYSDQGENQRVGEVIVRLVQARLLVKGQQETGEPYVEPAHDFLVRGWGMLQEWIEQEKENETLELQQRLTAQVNDWNSNKQLQSLLWSDKDRLQRLKKILKSTDNWLNKRETEFAESSIKENLVKPELQEKAGRVKNLYSLNKRSESFLLAIQAMGENIEELPEEILSSVQGGIQTSMEISKEYHIFRGHEDSVRSVAFSPDGQMIVSGSTDGTVRLWDLKGNSIGQPFTGQKSSINSVAFSPNGQMIVSGSYPEVYLWDLKGNSIGQPFAEHEDSFNSVAFSPNGQMIVSGGNDQTVRLWDLKGNSLGQPFIGHENLVYSVAFRPDGRMIVSSSKDCTVRLWNLKGNSLGQLFTGYENSFISFKSVAFSPDGQMIVSGGDNGTVGLWKIEDNYIGQPFYFYIDIDQALSGLGETVNSVAFSPDGQMIVGGSSDGTVRLWDSKGNSLGQPFTGHEDCVNSVAFSPDGQMIVSGGDDKTVRLWEIESNYIGQPFTGHENSVHSVAFSPDGQMIISGSTDGTVRLWDSKGNFIGQFFTGHENSVNSVAFSPNGEMIVSGGENGTVILWDLEGNSIGQVFTGHEDSVNSVAFSPDGQMIVSGGDGTVRLWDLEGNSIAQPFTGHEDSVNLVAFSPNEQMIVSGSRDKTVRLWDLEGNSIGQPFAGHEDWVESVAFSPDGQMIVSGSRDKTVRLWDLEGNFIGQPFTGHEKSVNSVAFSPDGQMIVSGSSDKTVRLWRGNWKAWLKVCCNRLRYHPVFTKPEEIENPEERSLAIAACTTCKKYVWNKADSSTK